MHRSRLSILVPLALLSVPIGATAQVATQEKMQVITASQLVWTDLEVPGSPPA